MLLVDCHREPCWNLFGCHWLRSIQEKKMSEKWQEKIKLHWRTSNSSIFCLHCFVDANVIGGNTRSVINYGMLFLCITLCIYFVSNIYFYYGTGKKSKILKNYAFCNHVLIRGWIHIHLHPKYQYGYSPYCSLYIS